MDSITKDFPSVVRGPTYITNYKVPPPPLKAFLVTYKGLWLGGKAVVLADCADTACDMVREHKSTITFEQVEATEVGQGDKACVLFNDKGDY